MSDPKKERRAQSRVGALGAYESMAVLLVSVANFTACATCTSSTSEPELLASPWDDPYRAPTRASARTGPLMAATAHVYPPTHPPRDVAWMRGTIQQAL